MKIKTFIFSTIILFLVALNLILFNVVKRASSNILKNYSVKKIKVEDISLNIPIGFKQLKIKESNNWKIYPFKSGKTFFRVSVTPGNEENLVRIVKNALKIKSLPRKEKFILSKLCFIKRMDNPEGSFYFLNHKNKKNRYVFVSHLNGKVYYVDFFAPSTILKYKELFDKTILSIGINKGSLFSDKQKTEIELKGICKKTYYILCQPEKILIFGIPSIVGIIILFVLMLTISGMGKLPENFMDLGIVPVYYEENVDTIFRIFTKRQWFLTAFVVDANGIHIFYRKKEMVFISKDRAKEELKNNKSFFGNYLEIELNKKELKNPPIDIKYALIYNINFHFYLKDTDRVLSFIKY
ncbi:hypothetical protein TTHT_1599 [Thermotomaculum hydrothermale]|uniref:Uncharacterized protein n=1 Tax=Thermotomaculum hydrothermale TaxID=981385 RepID=A0A7R6Q085_9BACT|nr:hypothetical protein [Thermotomaculum hydrothermale]BBB33088.1 hypothetical protein TTHT_1599 [Thermotomaculum hydrothermale]